MSDTRKGIYDPKKPMKPAKIKTDKNVIQVLALLLVCVLNSGSSIYSQQTKTEEVRITLDVRDEPLNKVLTIIEQQTSFRFAYSSDLVLQQKNITLKATNIKFADLLNALFEGTSISYSIIGNQVVLQKYIPSRITVSGYVRDKKSGESLIGTSIYLPGLQNGVTSNNYGFYSLTVQESDSLELEISYVGYKTINIKINGHKDASLNFSLNQKEDAISSVRVLKDKRENNIKRNQVDLVDLSTDMFTTAAAVTGNGDIISSVQLSAGVQTGLDGATGYFVRGGNTDQNQVLLDEATLYNPSHLFGLVSVFNSSAIKRASLLKGGFPAVYGDYLSSVLDVYMKDGSNQQFGGELQLGTIASSIELHGPLNSEKSSFLLSGRRSAIDWTIRPFSTDYYFSNYYFYDVNGKLNFQLSGKDRLFMSYYRGADHNSYTTDADDEDQINYKIAFGNQAFNLRWNHLFSKKLFSNISAVYSNYYQRLSSIQEDYFAQLYSGIRDINFKTDFYYYPHIKHKIRGGVNYLLQSVFPATVSDKLSTTGFININQNNIPEKRHNRFAAYISDDIKVTNHFNIYAGMRLPVFFKPGVRYVDIEPRLSLLYLLNTTSSIKLAYSRMHQYIHLVQSYNASFPAEIWIGSSSLVKPQASHQVSAGLYKNFNNNNWQASIEGYYKLMDNQMLFKGGSTSATIDNDIESKLIFGKGWSFGTEFVLRKTTGDFRGWISYSLSQAYQLFDSLNLGLKFPFANNRKHNFYLSGLYDFNDHWSFAANLFLTSGRSVTLNQNPSPPPSSGSQDDNPLFEDDDNGGSTVSTEPNNFHLTPYSRLDLGISYKKTRNTKKRKWESEWRLSVYNVYAHRNTYFAYRSIDPVTRQASINQVSFIPVIPSLTYSLKF